MIGAKNGMGGQLCKPIQISPLSASVRCFLIFTVLRPTKDGQLPFTDKSVAGDLAIRFDLGALSNFDKHTYLGMVANLATICRTQRTFRTPRPVLVQRGCQKLAEG